MATQLEIDNLKHYVLSDYTNIFDNLLHDAREEMLETAVHSPDYFADRWDDYTHILKRKQRSYTLANKDLDKEEKDLKEFYNKEFKKLLQECKKQHFFKHKTALEV